MKKEKSLIIRYFLAFLAATVLIFAVSCQKAEGPGSDEILKAMIKSAKDLKTGSVYTTLSSPGASDYLSDNLLLALYGRGQTPDVLKRTFSISLRTSSGLYAEEFAVFHCGSSRDREEIFELCLHRIDSICHFINANSQKLSLDSGINATIDNAKVIILGDYVIMALSKNSDAAIKAARELIS